MGGFAKRFLNGEIPRIAIRTLTRRLGLEGPVKWTTFARYFFFFSLGLRTFFYISHSLSSPLVSVEMSNIYLCVLLCLASDIHAVGINRNFSHRFIHIVVHVHGMAVKS